MSLLSQALAGFDYEPKDFAEEEKAILREEQAAKLGAPTPSP